MPNEKTSSEVNIEVIGDEPTRKISRITSNEELSKTEGGKKVDDDKQTKLSTQKSSKAAAKAAIRTRSKAKKDEDVRDEYVKKNVELEKTTEQCSKTIASEVQGILKFLICHFS